jgi:type I restriction enzyme M protein
VSSRTVVAELPPHVDAIIDDVHDALRADLGLESSAALAFILDRLGSPSTTDDPVDAITRPLARLGEADPHLASKLAARLLTSGARRYTGLYPTPASITRLASELLRLAPGSRVLDPACGAGAFLLPFAAHAMEIHGVDRNPQMMTLARHALGSAASLTLVDALAPLESLPEALSKESFDAVVMNPPFGVRVDAGVARTFTCGGSKARTPSELLFLERAAEWLRPGGRLAAIVPAGVFRNRGQAQARRFLEGHLRLVLAVELPPEAFMHAGARMASVFMLAEKRGAPPTLGRDGEVFVDSASDVGHDRLGNPLVRSDLDRIRERGLAFLDGAPARAVPRGREMSSVFSESNRASARDTRRLDQLCEVIRLGKTPPREAYADTGQFIVKVGNLTGHGLDFTPRERNFVTEEYARSVLEGRVGAELTLQPGDLLVTSSAHARRYIAEKVDVVAGVPEWLTEPVFYVGELMLLRPAPGVHPCDLLGYLRSRSGKSALRRLVRGQTAHLLPRDVRALHVPAITPSTELRAHLEREAQRALAIERDQRAIASLADQLYPEPTDD